MYEPCAVCGNVSHGYHYGALVCFACRQFFRKAFKNHYVCPAEGDCRISKSYTGCKSCRLAKCLEMGMQSSNFVLNQAKKTFETLAFPYLTEVFEWVRGVAFFAELHDSAKKELLLNQWPSLLLLEISRPGSGLRSFDGDKKIHAFLSRLREFEVTPSELVFLKILVLFMRKKGSSYAEYKYKYQYEKSICFLKSCSFTRQDSSLWVRRIVILLNVWIPTTSPFVRNLMESKHPEIFDRIVQGF
ncbi:hypothetical protein CAEBREN_02594 [Caenorhabditis brenneri]|uniref:Nuclear receptor domain-containing protein n=1 Tax=Caenorhabditis brenneri TaxID=135651 RepID=G0NQH8_CAEBE|nr:hypothetical protein CAEBREN_02594 [Caenorhabditis brenneri]